MNAETDISVSISADTTDYANINKAFCGLLLRSAMEEVRLMTTAEERRKTWVYHFGRGHWEFHGPGHFYWHGEADSNAHARALGWSKWIEKLTTIEEHRHELEERLGDRRERWLWMLYGRALDSWCLDLAVSHAKRMSEGPRKESWDKLTNCLAGMVSNDQR